MLNLKKLFHLPGPKELGLSDRNAMPMKDFGNPDNLPTWEDYYDLIKKRYPVRYFITQTLTKYLRLKIIFPLRDLKYWIVSHTIRRYHKLDLRQPYKKGDVANYDCYRYGWCDVPEKMLYAIFNLLKEYFDENPYDLNKDYSKEEIEADEQMKQQQASYDEAKAILYWWQVERKEEQNKINKLLHDWSGSRSKEQWEELNKTEKNFELKTDEMIARLFKIRRNLWT